MSDDPNIENSGEDQYFDPRPVQRARAVEIWSYSDTGHELTVEEQLFCRSYIIDRCEVAAMQRLGYCEEPVTLRNRAKKLMANPEVQGCIEALAKRVMENLEITAEKVNRGIASIAFTNMNEVMEFDHAGVRILHSKFWTKDQAACIQSVKMTKDGVEVKFYDRQRALEFLAKQHGAEDEATAMQRAMARGAAEAAIDKVMEVAAKMRAAKVIEG